jgi:hypothetical protein
MNVGDATKDLAPVHHQLRVTRVGNRQPDEHMPESPSRRSCNTTHRAEALCVREECVVAPSVNVPSCGRLTRVSVAQLGRPEQRERERLIGTACHSLVFSSKHYEHPWNQEKVHSFNSLSRYHCNTPIAQPCSDGEVLPSQPSANLSIFSKGRPGCETMLISPNEFFSVPSKAVWWLTRDDSPPSLLVVLL